MTRKTILIGICLALVLLGAPALSTGAGATELVIGKVSSNPKKHYRYLKPIADYVAAQMADLGITGAKVLMARNDQQLIRYLRQGRVDWVTDTPFATVIYQDAGVADPLVRKWKKGVAEYHTIFIARRDSGIRSLADLAGRTIAFEDPGSTSAFLVPYATLVEQGMDLVELASPREEAPEGRIGYVFSKEEINTSNWVHKGIVDAGAYSNLDWDTKDHLPRQYQEDMVIFHTTPPMPRAIESVRRGLDPRIKERLRSILLGLHDDPDAENILKAYQKTTRFDELTDEILAGLDTARRLREVIQGTGPSS